MTAKEHLAIVGEYKHGSIRRIKLRNFLTYFEAEFTPGPRLNMVVGPNGTGKSTILCAICLGLGGEPKLLGRASEVETFIANGEEESEIEIELVNTNNKDEDGSGGGGNAIVRREIRKSGSPKSSFFWNGKPCTAKSVKQRCLDEYHITVDNLCTFLPQDKVGNFSGFDSKQLLIETEKALTSSQKHFHTHMELIKQQEEMQGGENRKETLEDRLRHLETEGKRLERAKDLMEERDTAIQQSDLLRKKTMWLEFDEKVAMANHKKAAQKDLKAKLKQISESLAPLENEFKAAEDKLSKFTTDINALDGEIRSAMKEMEKQHVKGQKHDDRIIELQGEIEVLAQKRAVGQQKVEMLQEKLDGYVSQLKGFPALETLKNVQEQCQHEYRAAQTECQTITRKCSALVANFNEIQDEMNRVNAKIVKLGNEQERRKERIFRQQPNLKTISDWLNVNRGKFRKDVFGPVVCDVTPKDANTAAYLEMHVPNAALKSFVVQCKEDYDLLYRSIREELGIPINVTVIESIKQDKRLYSDQKMEVLKREHGVLGYMDETIDAPPLIVEALKNAGQIHKVLIGSEKTQDSLDSKGLLEYLGQQEDGQTSLISSCIFSTKGGQGFKYQTVISKYSGKGSTRVDSVRPAKWLAPGVSDQEKEKLQAELADIAKRRDEAAPEVADANQNLDETQLKAQTAAAKLKDAKENLLTLSKLKNRMDTTEAKLQEAQNDLQVDGEVEKKRCVDEIGNRIHGLLQALEKHSDCYKMMMKGTIKASGIRLNLEVAKAMATRLRDQLREAQIDYRKAEKEYEVAKNDYKAAIKEVHQLKQEADIAAPLHDEDGNDTPLKAQLEALGVDTLPEALAALEEAEQKAESIEADHNAIREYVRNKEETENVRSQLDDLCSSEEQKKRDLEEKVRPWEDTLTKAVSKVNILFATYMSEMGCTGEVALTQGVSTPDMPFGNFKDWGVEIRVSFRGNTNLQVLSARVQSGGERSVSTIMYLMALQDMMVSPFRCVDEINQGLDERNERLVFKRIVTNSTRQPGKKGLTDHSGQYFLITPKLLPNLYDMEVEAMTVLFIFNGPFNVKNPRDFDSSKLLSLRKRRAIDGDAAHDEEKNSPNSQPSDSIRLTKQARRSLTTRHVEAGDGF